MAVREERYLSRPVLGLCRVLMAASPKAWLGYFVEDGPGAKVGHVDWETGHVREYRLVGFEAVGERTYLELESPSGGRLLAEPCECVPAQVLAQGGAVERAISVPLVFDRASRALDAASRRGARVASSVRERLVDLGRRAEKAFRDWLARGAEAVRAAGATGRGAVAAGRDAVAGTARSARDGAVRMAAGVAVGAARALRKPLEAAAGGLKRAEERWSVWLRQVPAGSELAGEALSEKVGASAAVAVVEDGGRVFAPAGEGFREVSEAALDAEGPVVGRVTDAGLECGPLSPGVEPVRAPEKDRAAEMGL